MSVIGVPVKVLHEAEGHIVTIETTSGEVSLLLHILEIDKCKMQVYRGKLIEAEDNMNSQMASVTVTYRDGRVAQLENIYIRGSKIRFMILPDMLKNAPMFKNMMTRFDPNLRIFARFHDSGVAAEHREANQGF